MPHRGPLVFHVSQSPDPAAESLTPPDADTSQQTIPAHLGISIKRREILNAKLNPAGLEIQLPAVSEGRMLRYSGPVAVEMREQDQSRNERVANFTRACAQDIPTTHFAFLKPNQQRSLKHALSFAVTWRSTHAHLCANSGAVNETFAQMIYDQVLMISHHQAITNNRKSAKALLEPAMDHPGRYELKPEVEKAVRLFAGQCIASHGTMLDAAPAQSTKR